MVIVLVPRLAEAYVPGILLRRLRRCHHLDGTIRRSLGPPCTGLTALARNIPVRLNILTRLNRTLSERGKLWCVRGAVMVLSVVARIS